MDNQDIKEILRILRAKSIRYEYCLKENISYNDESYEAHLLLDYITTLQEENERLRKGGKGMTYKKRCQLVIEYIKENQDMVEWIHIPAWELLNILQGDGKQ